jgi:SAM-dependent methyltransferase
MTGGALVWHDVEHGGYDADLPLWRHLAETQGDPVLDLGAGTGRVAAHLAAVGHEVVALDTDPDLLLALTERAPTVTTVTADARDFKIHATFPLVIAPMQLIQILGGAAGRAAMLDCVRAHLQEGGLFAAALARPLDAIPYGPGRGSGPAAPDADLAGGDLSPPLPDMLERDGWVFSSQPVAVEERNGSVVVTRRRQSVSPAGEIEEEEVEIALDVVGIEDFEGELRAAGFRDLGRLAVAETDDHIGSVVVTCRR